MADATATATASVPFFKKKSKGSTATKKRAISPSLDTPSPSTSKRLDEDRGEGPSVVRTSKREAFNPLKQGTGIKRRKRDDAAAGDDEEDSFDLGDMSKPSVRYGDSRVNASIKQQDEEEAESILTGEAALAKSGEQPGEDEKEGIYRGAANYKSQVSTSEKYAPTKGPSANIKTITLMDYQADRCKDYAETGWCGFGDSCKFLHDRSDYKHGWEMDNSFLSNQPKKQVEDVNLEEELPFACIICREPFGDPKSPHAAVVTRCGHYFGSSCAIKRYTKNPKCYACGAGTQGIFNRGDKILERMDKMQKARLKRAEEEQGTDYTVDGEGDANVEIEGLAEG